MHSAAEGVRGRAAGEGSRWRAVVEGTLRVVVLVALAAYLTLVLRGEMGRSEGATSTDLRPRLERWSTVTAPARLHLSLSHPPSGTDRDWLGALTALGTEVRWNGPSLVPTAILVEPRADPAGGVDAHVAMPSGARVTLRDTIGELGGGVVRPPVRVWIPHVQGPIDAIVGVVTARGAQRDSLVLKRLLVIGAANWETKFTVAALEERGWAVDAHIVVSPKGDVRQGTIADIDTARYSAVVAMDTAAARYASRIVRFVRAGGGLVLWAPAARVAAFAALAPAAGVGPVVQGSDGQPDDTVPRAVLEFMPLRRLAANAVVLERRGDLVSVAARRIGAGRVIQVGYTNSWRWRMAGGGEAPDAHRAWLAALVARVAHVGRVDLPATPTAVAPLATLIDRLGPPSATAERPRLHASALLPWLFAAVSLALFLEWSSRRLRGVK